MLKLGLDTENVPRTRLSHMADWQLGEPEEGCKNCSFDHLKLGGENKWHFYSMKERLQIINDVSRHSLSP